MAVLKRLGVISVAKIEAVIMAAVGLILGIFVIIASSIAGLYGVGTRYGMLSIIILPIIYGIIGFVAGAIGAFLYNVIAQYVGGIEMEFENKKKKKR